MVRGNGIDTVVLWDLSGSTSGKLFLQIKESIIYFIRCKQSFILMLNVTNEFYLNKLYP